MTIKAKVVSALFAAAMLAVSPAIAAEDKHSHEAKVFATVSAGLTALDQSITAAKTKAAAGDMEALHGISEDLHGIAEGLRKKMGDVAADAKDRYKFNVDQVDALHAQLEAAHESANKDDVARVIKRLEDVSGRLKTLVAAK